MVALRLFLLRCQQHHHHHDRHTGAPAPPQAGAKVNQIMLAVGLREPEKKANVSERGAGERRNNNGLLSIVTNPKNLTLGRVERVEGGSQKI